MMRDIIDGARSTVGDSVFLPDFCAIRTVFTVVVVGELLAFVLALTRYSGADQLWSNLALISLFVQWVALTSMGLLCVSRRWLRRWDNVVVAVVSYVLVIVVTLLFSEVAYWLVKQRVVVMAYSANQPAELPLWFSQGRVVDISLPDARHAEFLLRNLAVSAIVTAVALRYFFVQFQWKANLESEAQSRIQALQSRIRPHFLFNCMNTIANFTRSKPKLAEQVVEDLADLFRVSLGDARIPVTLSRELEICRQYLRIEGLRLGERLAVRWEVERLPGDALLPALSLQPLLENAIYHGIEPAPSGGEIRIRGERNAAGLRLVIVNSTATPERASRHEGNQMAQDNVGQRLRAFFGPGGTLRATVSEGEYRVELAFPYLTSPPAAVA